MLTLSFNVLAAGAGMPSGLALSLPIPKANVESVSLQTASGAPVSLTLRAADSNAVIDLLDDTKDNFQNLGPFVNTDPSIPAQPETKYKLTVRLSSAVQVSPSEAPFDLFFFHSDDVTHEIHRPMFAGTASMNQALFNTEADKSTASRHFVDRDGLPFVLDIPKVPQWAKERVSVDLAYPQVVGFASSGGSQNATWYNAPVAQHIYAPGAGGGTMPVASFIPGENGYLEGWGDDSCVSCSDGIQNGYEEGVDCGGSCANPCYSCSDGVQNQGEAGVDCGGPCPNSCVIPLGGACSGVNLDYWVQFSAAPFQPTAIELDADGNVYVGDRQYESVWKFGHAGDIATSQEHYVTNMPSGSPRMGTVADLLWDDDGNLLTSDAAMGTTAGAGVTRVLPGLDPNYGTHLKETVVSGYAHVDGPVPGTGKVWGLGGIDTAEDGTMYMGQLSYVGTLRRLQNGVLRSLLNNGTWGVYQSGGTPAYPVQAWSLRVGPDGNIYAPDLSGGRVLKITPSGTVTVLAGNGTRGAAIDGQGTNAQFNYIWGIEVDAQNNVYVGDAYNNKIRKITPSGMVTTVWDNSTFKPYFLKCHDGRMWVSDMDGGKVYFITG